MFNFKHLSKKRIILVVVLILAITTFVFAPLLVKAQEDTGGEVPEGEEPNKVVIKIVSWIIIPIVNFIGNLITMVIRLLTTVAQYNDFINSPAVSKGWIIIRDIFNMFFILVLLVIAFSTVLKIERYSYKKLLGGFLLAAVLVNFSKLICGFIIDISQILMLTFVNSFKNIGEGNFAEMLGITDIMNWNKNVAEITTGSALGSLLLGLIMSIIALVVIVVITIILVFRIVYLWFLVLLSPVAFVANVLPNLKRYSSRWWQKFGSQVVIGPVLAFFLWLSLAVVQDTSDLGLYSTVVNPETGEKIKEENLNIGSTESGTPQNMLSFVIGIAMLMGSLLIAQEMGVAGGKIAGNVSGKITSIAKGASKLPFKGVKAAGRATWKGTGLEARTISAKEGLAEGRFGKVGDFLYKRTKDGKKETDSERLYRARLRSHGIKGEDLKSRMSSYKAEIKEKKMEDQFQFQTAKDKKNKLKELEEKGKIYTTEGLALSKSLAKEDQLDEKYYKGFGKNMGEYVENDLRKKVKPKNILLGTSAQKTKEDLTKKYQGDISTMKPTEIVKFLNNLDAGLEYDEESNEYKAKSERSIQGLQAFSKEKFSNLSPENKKKFLDKMGLVVGNGESNNGSVYNLTPEEFEGFKKQYKEYVNAAKEKKEKVDIKEPKELKKEYDKEELEKGKNIEQHESAKKQEDNIVKDIITKIKTDPEKNNEIKSVLEEINNNIERGNRSKAEEKFGDLKKIISSFANKDKKTNLLDNEGKPLTEKEIIEKRFEKTEKEIVDKDKKPSFEYIANPLNKEKKGSTKKESINKDKKPSPELIVNDFLEKFKELENKLPKNDKGEIINKPNFEEEKKKEIKEITENLEKMAKDLSTTFRVIKNKHPEKEEEVKKIEYGIPILSRLINKESQKTRFSKDFKRLKERIDNLKEIIEE